MSDSVFRRKIYDQLLAWKQGAFGRTALLVEGARRVGKSTIVEAFAKKEYESYILIDFAFAPRAIHDLFLDVSDLNYLFLQLQLQYSVKLTEGKSLIIFDEVQFCPLARQAIKLLVKDGRYDYIQTGSLVSIHKNIKDILIPSEEKKISIYPMDYEEFLWANGDTATVPLLAGLYQSRKPLGEAQNRNMMRKFRLYMLIGGMPQVVKAYLDDNNFEVVDQIKRNILALYQEDFYKINPSGKMAALFNAIPAELGRHAARYQVSSVLKNDRAASIAEEFSELAASKTVLPAYHVSDPNVGMAQSRKAEKFRLYLLDTGLLVSLMFWDKAVAENILYQKLLNDKLPVNLGIVYENMVAQTLTARGHSLYYYTFYNQTAKKNYEIDFLITAGNKICPIEVKSSGYQVHSSLDRFFEKYSERISHKIVIHTKDFQRKGDTVYLPIYLAQFL